MNWVTLLWTFGNSTGLLEFSLGYWRRTGVLTGLLANSPIVRLLSKAEGAGDSGPLSGLFGGVQNTVKTGCFRGPGGLELRLNLVDRGVQKGGPEGPI